MPIGCSECCVPQCRSGGDLLIYSVPEERLGWRAERRGGGMHVVWWWWGGVGRRPAQTEIPEVKSVREASSLCRVPDARFAPVRSDSVCLSLTTILQFLILVQCELVGNYHSVSVFSKDVHVSELSFARSRRAA